MGRLQGVGTEGRDLSHMSIPIREYPPHTHTEKTMNKENRMTPEVDVSKPLSLSFQSLYSGLTNGVIIVAKKCPWPMNARERPHGMGPLSSDLTQLLATAECSTCEQKRPTLSPDVILPFKEDRQALGGELMTLDVFDPRQGDGILMGIDTFSVYVSLAHTQSMHYWRTYRVSD